MKLEYHWAAYLIAASNQGPTSHVQEAHVFGNPLPPVKLSGLDIPIDFHVAFRWAHILAKGHNIDTNLPQFW